MTQTMTLPTSEYTVDPQVDPHQYPLTEGSVMGLHPREKLTMAISEGLHGYTAIAYTGDGSKPGSVLAAGGGFTSPWEAYVFLIGDLQKELLPNPYLLKTPHTDMRRY